MSTTRWADLALCWLTGAAIVAAALALFSYLGA